MRSLPTLRISFHKGRMLAAYLYLARPARARAARSRKMAASLVVDFLANGAPLGIEILHPYKVTLSDINAILSELGQEPIGEDAFRPLAQLRDVA
jgi:hypothetical protein